MRKYLICLFVAMSPFSVSSQDESVLIDERDGNSYSTISIDSVRWMNENLRFHTSTSVLNNNSRLYSYFELDGLCPEGWRLPSTDEFESLLLHLGQPRNRTLYLSHSWAQLPDVYDFNFQPDGMANRKKIWKNSWIIWLLETNLQAPHVHMYRLKKTSELVLLQHAHEAKNTIINKRKLAVRCVCASNK